MASKPNFLLFDDPTSGLDPITATTVDDEIVKLRDVEHVTSIVVTHQIRDAFYLTTHEAARENGRLRILTVPEGRRLTRASWCFTRAGSTSRGVRRNCGRRPIASSGSFSS